jgi:hypothetical protein
MFVRFDQVADGRLCRALVEHLTSDLTEPS